VLKELFLAALVLANPAVAMETTASLGAAIRAVADLPEEARARAAELAGRIAGTRQSLNLSLWAQSLARTADRVGLLVCGDVVRAAAAVKAIGNDLVVSDLLDFATGPGHRAARAMLGLSIEV
jgi:hypothetical protein